MKSAAIVLPTGTAIFLQSTVVLVQYCLHVTVLFGGCCALKMWVQTNDRDSYMQEAFMLTTDDAREWMHSDQDPGLLAQESDDSEDEDGINFDELMGEEDSDEDEEENEDEDMNMGAADKKQASEKNGQGNEKDSSTAKLSIKSNGKSKGPDADSGSDSDEGEAKKGANGKASKEVSASICCMNTKPIHFELITVDCTLLLESSMDLGSHREHAPIHAACLLARCITCNRLYGTRSS